MFFRRGSKKPTVIATSTSSLPTIDSDVAVKKEKSILSKTPPAKPSVVIVAKSNQDERIEDVRGNRREGKEQIEGKEGKEQIEEQPEFIPIEELIAVTTPSKGNNNNDEKEDVWFAKILDENKQMLSLMKTENKDKEDEPSRIELLEKEILSLKTRLKRSESHLKTALDKFIEQKEKFADIEKERGSQEFQQRFSSDVVRSKELIQFLSTNLSLLERSESDERERSAVLSHAYIRHKKQSDELEIKVKELEQTNDRLKRVNQHLHAKFTENEETNQKKISALMAENELIVNTCLELEDKNFDLQSELFQLRSRVTTLETEEAIRLDLLSQANGNFSRASASFPLTLASRQVNAMNDFR